METATLSPLEMGRQQAEQFKANNVAFTEMLVTHSYNRNALVRAYNRLVRDQKITAVEDMLMKDKITACEMTKDIAKERLDGKGLRELLKALLAIEYFLSL